MNVIPAITVWQPWATLIAEGVKPYEFRKWPAPRAYRGQRIAIHAGARKMVRAEIQDLLLRLDRPNEAWTTGLDRTKSRQILESALSSPGLMSLSAVVCTAVLGQPVAAAQLIRPEHGDSARPMHNIWGWPMLEIQRLDPPVPARGAQGFWNWNNAV